MRVRNKVIVVTGGGHGIGRALVLELLLREARVAAVDIDAAALEETATLAGARAKQLSTHVADVADREAVAALPAQIIARHGVVDGLINNAGIIQPFVSLLALEEAAIERVMRVNFYGTLAMTRAFLPHLLTRPTAHLINISSMGGFLPVPGQTIYGASKAAVKLLTEGLYAELLDSNVRVSVVFPGAVGTDIAAHSGVAIVGQARRRQMARVLSPARAAQIILDGVERNRFRILVGPDARLMDRLYRFSPERAVRLIERRMRDLLSS